MAESEDTSKKETTDAETETKVEGGDALAELPLEELDKVIATSDPEFAAALDEVSKEKFDDKVLDDNAFEYTLEIEKKSWEQKKGFAAKIFKIFPAIAVINFYFYQSKNKGIEKWLRFKQQSILFIKSIPPLLKAKALIIKGTTLGVVQAIAGNFKAQSKKGKIWFITVIVFSISSVVLSVVILKKGMLKPPKPLFMVSLNEWAESVEEFNPKEDIESFYDSTRAVQNVFGLNRIVVNIKPSTNSGENPMAAFEFVLEGNSSEAVIEVKDREAEVRDLFQRVIETKSYDQLSSVEGKQQLTDALRSASNRVLTQGKIRRIYIKTAIIKP